MILVDIDGVCLDLLGAIKEKLPAFEPDMVRSYDFKEGSFGATTEEVRSYLTDREVFELEKPYRRVKYGLAQLKTLDTVKGWTFVPMELVDLRVAQMEDLGIEGFVYTSLPKNKETIDVKVVIEDNPEALKMYEGTGILRILVTRSYNLKSDDYDYRVSDLKEAYKVIKGSGIY